MISALENSSEVVKVVGTDGILRYASPAFARVLGYDPGEAVGVMNVLDYVHPDDLDHVLSETQSALAEGGAVSNRAEYRFRHADGSWRWVESVGTYLLDDPRVGGVVVSVRDVTGRKEAEERLHLQAQLLEMVGEAVIALDTDRKVVYWNRAAEELYGWSAEEMVGRRLVDRVIPKELRARAEEIMAGVRAGLSWKGEFEVRRSDGSRLTVEATNTPVSGKDGEPVGVVGVLRDVTERRETEDALRRSEAELFSVLESITDGFFLLDKEWRFAYVNPQAEAMLNRSREDLVGEVIHEDPTFYPEYRRAAEERVTVEFEGYYPPVGRWYDVRAYPSETGLSVYFQDVTERKEAEDALRRSEERYRTVVEKQTDLVCRFLPDLTLTFANEAYARYFGQSPEELIGLTFLDHIHESDHAYYEQGLRWLSPENPTATVEERFFAPGGVRWLQWTDTAIFDGEGRVLEYQSVGRDVTERRALEERLEHQALHDPLTGLPNRRLFASRLGEALRGSRRREGGTAAVLYMDLDNFKGINDSLGHQAGDLLLVVVAERLRRCLGPEDTLARFGGDEFVVLLEDIRGRGEAVEVARRVTEAFGRPFLVYGRELYARASIGIALGDTPGDARGEAPEDLLRDADTAMYRVKEAGGGGYRVFEPAMHERALALLDTESGLRRALGQGELVVHYQPVVSLETGEAWGLEALVRWEHPERGLLDPDEFVPVAEESGLVVPMGVTVLEEACLRAREWQRDHPRMPPLVMSVNLSAKQFGRRDFAAVVEETLRKTGLEAACLVLDVTETVYVGVLEGNTEDMSRLRALGVGISIDDFGTGYSSLSYLKRLPADALKIDRSFVKGLGEDAEDTAIVGMIIELAHTLGMEVIAEGVETAQQLDLLKEMGCDKAQGYHLSEPLTPGEVADLLGRGPS